MENKQEGDGVEIFTEDSIITLYDDQNAPFEFFEIASIEYDGKFYELLQPVEKVEGIEEDEAVIFEYTVEEESGEKLFKPIYDQKLLESVFSLYISAAADYEACGCGCSSCGHDHSCGGCDSDKPEQVDEKPATEKPAKKATKNTKK